MAKLTRLYPKDNILFSALEDLGAAKRGKIVNRLVWTQLFENDFKCEYGYSAIDIPKRIIVEMIESGYVGHLLYRNIHTNKLELVTKKVLDSVEFKAVYQVNYLISGICLISIEARNFILKFFFKTFSCCPK